MIGKLGSVEIYAFCEPVDMRKGFEGLAGIVRNGMGLDPLGGALFLFTNRPNHRLVVEANGGRVMEYSLDDENVLYVGGTRVQQGSTFWVAPQSAWTNTDNDWPPPTTIDENPYTYVLDGDTATFTSQEGSSLGISVKKEFSMLSSGEVTLNYTITALRDLAGTPWSPWEVSRHAPGLCFYRSGGEAASFAYNLEIADPISIVEDSGVSWAPYSGAPMPKNGELLADSSGWAGCAFESTRHLLLKRFVDVSAGNFAVGNGDLKIWWQLGDSGGTEGVAAFLELEPIGPATVLGSGEMFTYEVVWTLVELPTDVSISPGPSLAEFLPSP